MFGNNKCLIADDEHGRMKKVIVAVSIIASSVIVMLLAFYICRTKFKVNEDKVNSMWIDDTSESEHDDFELPFFDLVTILEATNNFSIDNKLGEGGFGPVYKVYLNLP
jgi:hypothetical protein